MRNVLLWSAMLLLPFTSLLKPAIRVEGTVVSDQTGKPVGFAHVYIVDGEEEALTNAKGEFKIESSKAFPVKITVEHKDFQKTSVGVSSGGRQIIRLRPKG
jgi:hypothetical protein